MTEDRRHPTLSYQAKQIKIVATGDHRKQFRDCQKLLLFHSLNCKSVCSIASK